MGNRIEQGQEGEPWRKNEQVRSIAMGKIWAGAFYPLGPYLTLEKYRTSYNPSKK